MTGQPTLYRFDGRLTDAEREVYDAVDQGEYGPREYARATDRSPGTVGNLLSRARNKIDENGGSSDAASA